jgi:hypothetical protein
MTLLTPTTCRRLQQLPQLSTVWEGDRLALETDMEPSYTDNPEENRDCILWVDGVQGVVRAVDVVPATAGQAAIVRTLLQAIEEPMEGTGESTQPGRPKKIVVRNRELQFFLRGVLQDLDITIEYQPELPLIDQFCQGMQRLVSHRGPQVSPFYIQLLKTKAQDMWKVAPWKKLGDHQILAVTLNQSDIETLYVSIMGKIGLEFGLLFYRSLNSLKQFRQQIFKSAGSPGEAAEAFLQQDCFYLTYHVPEDSNSQSLAWTAIDRDNVEPEFGSIHPLEGMRSRLHQEELELMILALEGLLRFFHKHPKSFSTDSFPALSSRFRIPALGESEASQSKTIKVQTLPDLADELWQMGEMAEDEDDEDSDMPLFLQRDLIPEKALVSVGQLNWVIYDLMPNLPLMYHDAQEVQALRQGNGLPIIMVQTTAPKAKALIQRIQQAGGVEAICFNPGHDVLGDINYDIGLIVLKNGEMQIFGEYEADQTIHQTARKRWDERSSETQGICGLVIAKGVTGKSRGKPGLQEILALFEAQAASSEDLRIGPLQLQPLF